MEPLDPPPDIDPREHATDSWAWGDQGYHVVRHGDRWYAWVDAQPEASVYEVADEHEARAVLDREQAWWVFASEHGNRVARVEVADRPGTDLNGVLRTFYDAVLVDGGEAGVLLAIREEENYALQRLPDLVDAGEAFAVEAERFAEQVERQGLTRFPDIAAANLRYRAAVARSDTARVALGDAVRRHEARLRGERGLTPFMAHRLGVSREFLYRVLAGREWAGQTPGPSPSAGWTATAGFAIEGDGLRQAHDILVQVLETMGVSLTEDASLEEGQRGIWFARCRLDLTDLSEVAPDDALSRLRYIVRELPEVTWRAQARPGRRTGRFDWPSGWDTRDQVLVHPAVRAAEIQVHEAG
ncbi:hypothetical protein [Actinomadura opuntiae]|uniref:hypothetical protein n=1 Tax=Actinomadura sp. OS1-43 TaxID=604315 RepID=UPI00255AB16A|nr:hypothetical protein [Actinomadura sp. OS1-43]MDL4819766.1 hypothetical protein [Actinomadura sp. OS1-43]